MFSSYSDQSQSDQLQNPAEHRGEGIRSSSSSSAEQRRGDFSIGRFLSAHETREYSSFRRPIIAEQTRDDHSFGSTTVTAAMATFDSEYGAKSKEAPSASAGRTKITGKGRRANLVHWYTLKEILRVSFHISCCEEILI